MNFLIEENRKVFLSNNFIILPATRKAPLVAERSFSEGWFGLKVPHSGARRSRAGQVGWGQQCRLAVSCTVAMPGRRD